jgi:hypothetical protein
MILPKSASFGYACLTNDRYIEYIFLDQNITFDNGTLNTLHIMGNVSDTVEVCVTSLHNDTSGVYPTSQSFNPQIYIANFSSSYLR